MIADVEKCSGLDDYAWLTSVEAAELAETLAGCSEPLHTRVGVLRRDHSAIRAHLVLELVELRRRAAEKFTQAERMFFTRVGLEQATDQWLAHYKAARFVTLRAGRSPAPIFPAPAFADLCCGVGGDLLAMAEYGSVTGIDQNPIAAHLAAANARAVLAPETSARATVFVANVEQFDVASYIAWHIDPDRRPTGPRTTSPDWSSPSRDAIDRLLEQNPNAAIKLAPAADIPQPWRERCELDWISRDRQCRQLVAWHGALAAAPGQTRATVLAARGLALRTLIGQPNTPTQIAERIERYIFDIDPAVAAAHLTGALAAEHCLAALDPGATYLTGPTAINDPALACFEVEDIVPFQRKTLARYLHQRNLGVLEIKKRGVDIDPEKLRRELKPRGDHSATLLITRHADRHIAIVARRVCQSS